MDVPEFGPRNDIASFAGDVLVMECREALGKLCKLFVGDRRIPGLAPVILGSQQLADEDSAWNESFFDAVDEFEFFAFGEKEQDEAAVNQLTGLELSQVDVLVDEAHRWVTRQAFGCDLKRSGMMVDGDHRKSQFCEEDCGRSDAAPEIVCQAGFCQKISGFSEKRMKRFCPSFLKIELPISYRRMNGSISL